MALLGWAAAVMVVLFAGIILYALRQRRDVKASLKIPFASFSFETTDRQSGKKK